MGALLLLLALSAPLASAAPDVTEVLAREGYAPEAYVIEMIWNETSPVDRSLVYGAHIRTVRGGVAVDVYYDGDGALLDSPTLRALKIVPKQWRGTGITQSAARTQAKSLHPNLAAKGADWTVDLFDLGVPDIAAAIEEDQLRSDGPSKGPVRVGIVSDLQSPIEVTPGGALMGQWHTLPGGTRVWALCLWAPGAIGQRLHFSEAHLPAGATLLLYDLQNPDRTVSPTLDASEFWTPTCFSEYVVVECSLPAGFLQAPDATLFVIDRASYRYRGVFPSAKQMAGACELDAMCFPDWDLAASAVAGMELIKGNASYWCTGTLITDGTAALSSRYFLTANHCISSAEDASNIEFFWLYRTLACDGPEPDFDTLDRTQGADYLVGSPESSGTDVTLLRMHEAPPEGLTEMGYSTEARPAATPVASIHHPNASAQHISFGALTTHQDPIEINIPPLDRFWRVQWAQHEGVTEPGSSGCGLLVGNPATGPLIIGQLFGGWSSCTSPAEPDYYGRFDKSYPLLAPWLSADTPGTTLVSLDIATEGNGYFQINAGGEELTQHSFEIASGIPVSLSAVAAPGAKFSGWRVGSAAELVSDNPLLLPMNANTQVTAVFEPKGFFLCGAEDTVSSGGDWIFLFGIALALLCTARRRGTAK